MCSRTIERVLLLVLSFYVHMLLCSTLSCCCICSYVSPCCFMCPHAALRRGRPRKREREGYRQIEREMHALISESQGLQLEGQKLLVVLCWNRDNCGGRGTLAPQPQKVQRASLNLYLYLKWLIGTSTFSNNLYTALKTSFFFGFYSMTFDNLMLSFIASRFDAFDHRLLAKLTIWCFRSHFEVWLRAHHLGHLFLWFELF